MMELVGRITEEVNRYWSEDVQIVGAWSERPTVACVVYRRRIDPSLILGARFEFTPNVADGTMDGYARDAAVNLAEPVGIQGETLRRDQHGIAWIAIPTHRPTPVPPVEVLQQLSG